MRPYVPIRPEFFTLRTASAWCGLSLRTLRRLMQAGLPTYRTTVGGKVLIRPKDLLVYLKRDQHTERHTREDPDGA